MPADVFDVNKAGPRTILFGACGSVTLGEGGQCLGGDSGGFGGESVVWRGYSPLAKRVAKFAVRQVADPGDIYPVFRELFATDKSTA